MKNSFNLALLTAFAAVLFSCSSRESATLYQIDPLYKVLKERTYFVDEPDTILAVRGEVTSLQIVLQAHEALTDLKAEVSKVVSEEGAHSISGAEAGWVGYVRVGRSYLSPSREIIRSASDYFPDPIIDDSLFSVKPGEVQPLWVSIPIDRDTEPGLYRGEVIIKGKNGFSTKKWKREFYIRVYPITLEEKSPLLVTNWSSHFNAASLSRLNNNQPVEQYSDLYWELVEMHAEMMVSHRQNVHRIFPVWLTQYSYKEGEYSFDFSRFDREVEIFDRYAPLERIEGGHLAWRSAGWNSPFYLELPLPDSEETRKMKSGINPLKVENGLRFVMLPIDDERTDNFLNQFLPAFREHLEKRGWLDRYMQHIADEPTAAKENVESYSKISSYLKKHLPGVKIFEAVLTSKELDGTIDVWVPELGVFHKDYNFYRELKEKGNEVWFYTCVGPQNNYANRFIELPLIQTRYLHWINYKYDATGYLHWGLNYWVKNQLYVDGSRDSGRLPAGDICIIYPGYRKLYSSIRFETMRDGIDDYQLLKMVEAKDPARANRIVSSIILEMNSYDNSVTYFREVRKQMLDFLAQ